MNESNKFVFTKIQESDRTRFENKIVDFLKGDPLLKLTFPGGTPLRLFDFKKCLADGVLDQKEHVRPLGVKHFKNRKILDHSSKQVKS